MKPIFALFLGCLTLPALADSERSNVPHNAEYKAECGSCHVAFPPGLLTRADWRKTMTKLEKHFGTDASLDAKAQARIQSFLDQNASPRGTTQANGEPRISRSSWFKREHREVPTSAWKDTRVKSAANCVACHKGAEQGRYGEHEIQIPGLARHHEREDD